MASPQGNTGQAPSAQVSPLLWVQQRMRYDNESGKGDHRHYGEREEAYRFVSLTRLVEDFKQDCARLAGWRWEE